VEARVFSLHRSMMRGIYFGHLLAIHDRTTHTYLARNVAWRAGPWQMGCDWYVEDGLSANAGILSSMACYSSNCDSWSLSSTVKQCPLFFPRHSGISFLQTRKRCMETYILGKNHRLVAHRESLLNSVVRHISRRIPSKSHIMSQVRCDLHRSRKPSSL